MRLSVSGSDSQIIAAATKLTEARHMTGASPNDSARGAVISGAVMLTGIVRSVTPAEIVQRAAIAAVISASCVRMFVRVLQTMAEQGANEN